MSLELDSSRKAARLALVDEHVRAEVVHDLDALVDTFGADPGFIDNSAREDHHGHDGVRAFYADLFAGFPDFSLGIERRHIAEETIILEVFVRGTHTGTWKGIPATGRRVDFPVCAIFTFDDRDRIHSETAYFDRMTVLSQLGVA